MRYLRLPIVVLSLAALSCRGGEPSSERVGNEVAIATVKHTSWPPLGGEITLCPATKIEMPEQGPRTPEFVCMIVSRAWAAILMNKDIPSLAARDSAGHPVSAEVSFWRDENGEQPPRARSVYWVVKFPSSKDKIGISVAVDSLTGKTLVHRDSEWIFKK